MQRTNAQRSEQPTCSPAEPSSLISIQSFRTSGPLHVDYKVSYYNQRKILQNSSPPLFQDRCTKYVHLGTRSQHPEMILGRYILASPPKMLLPSFRQWPVSLLGRLWSMRRQTWGKGAVNQSWFWSLGGILTIGSKEILQTTGPQKCWAWQQIKPSESGSDDDDDDKSGKPGNDRTSHGIQLSWRAQSCS